MKKIKNSQLFMIGLVIIILAIFMMSYNYLLDKKKTVYTKMNIKLFENEISQNIEVEKSENVENDNIEQVIEQPTATSEENKDNDKKPVSFEYIGLIEVPKINLKKGFLDPKSTYNKVDYNVTVINTSLFPNVDKGNFILAAHSGNAYNSYFGKLYKLKTGDVAYIYYKNVKYEYKIVKIYEVPKIGEVNIYRNFNATTLTLITCTLNSNTKQTVYIAELYKKSKY